MESATRNDHHLSHGNEKSPNGSRRHASMFVPSAPCADGHGVVASMASNVAHAPKQFGRRHATQFIPDNATELCDEESANMQSKTLSSSLRRHATQMVR